LLLRARPGTCFFLRLKIKMPMPPAPRIKSRPASRTPRLALQIFQNRHLRPASPAQNRPLVPFPARPNRYRMPRQRNMAILASIVDPATPHLDRYNIHRRVVVHAPHLRVEIDSANGRSRLAGLVCHRRLTGPRADGAVRRANPRPVLTEQIARPDAPPVYDVRQACPASGVILLRLITRSNSITRIRKDDRWRLTMTTCSCFTEADGRFRASGIPWAEPAG